MRQTAELENMESVNGNVVRDIPSERAIIIKKMMQWCAYRSYRGTETSLEDLRPLAANNHIHILNDFGQDVFTAHSLDEYISFWQSTLEDTFIRWDVRIASPIVCRVHERT